MKTKLRIGYVLIWTGALWMEPRSFSHVVPVHRAITVNAAASALSASAAYADFLNAVATDCDLVTATNAMVDGSDFEDDTDKDEGGKRSYNHFYDALTGSGLGNTPPDDQVAAYGRDSFIWAWKLNSPGVEFLGFGGFIARNVGTYNKWSWQNARDYEWHGLTDLTRSQRTAALKNMFRAVGQVAHLLEDTSQPQHTRNEQHLDKFGENGRDTPWRSPIEDYGKKYLETLNYQHSMLDWRAAGFAKLEDFWNRHVYNGNASALNGGAVLGLAEFSNGNFIGDRHSYPEYSTPGKVAYYPYPSRDKSTNYRQVKANPNSFAEDYTLKNGQQAKGIYIKKNSDGIPVAHHSRMNYLGGKGFFQPTGSGETPFCTIRDEKVLADYHAALIPMAVAYSAGLLDYFFRGRISGQLTWDSAMQKYTIHVSNDSGDAFGSGGTFTVLKEIANGDRSSIYQAALAAPMAANGTVDLTFAGPVAGATRFIVVFKGTIGLTGTTANDPVDANIAVAATTVDICQTPECWIATVQINKATPEFTVGNLQIISQQLARDHWEALCHSYPFPTIWEWHGNGGSCRVAATANYLWGESGSDAQVFCTYSANLTFANVTLHPTLPWTGAPFTLLITSSDTRIQVAPSSVPIPTGFSENIQLTLTQIAPFTATIKGDLVGNCVPPTAADWQANTTPALSVQP